MEAEERVLTKMGNGYKWRGAGQRYYGSPIIRVERTDGRTTQESLYTKDNGVSFAGPRCDNPEYIAEARALIRDYPIAPYAYVALTWCLKNHGNPSWREQGERAKKALEKLMKVQPHVLEIDAAYGWLVMGILEENVMDTGYIQQGEHNSYIPVGTPR